MSEPMTPEAKIRPALLRVAANVAKHIVERPGRFDAGDVCFQVDLRASETELAGLIRAAVAEEREACCLDVCPLCRRGNTIFQEEGVWLHDVGPGARAGCEADAIRARG